MSPFARYALVAALSLSPASLLWAQDDSAETNDQPTQAEPKKEPVNFRKIKEVLPDEIAGIKRTDAEGERNALGDFKFTRASGEYAPESDAEAPPQANLEIIDYSAAPQMAELATFWSQTEIDRESDDGYERTTKIKDWPAYESYQTESKHGEVQIYVDKRFHVVLRTDNLTAEQFQEAAKNLPLEKLAELKAE